MPVKRRFPKRRSAIDQIGLADWSMTFMTGRDYMGELAPFGLNEDAARQAARAAWQRLGAQFMNSWEPSRARDLPWAYTEFGQPPGGSRCP
jgi:hypothetical protein